MYTGRDMVTDTNPNHHKHKSNSMLTQKNIRAIAILQKIYSSQINYRCKFATTDNGKRWYCISRPRLACILGISLSQLVRLVKRIKEEHPGLLETQQKKKYINGYKTLYNTVTYWHINEELYKELNLPQEYKDIYYLYEQLAHKTKKGRDHYPILCHDPQEKELMKKDNLEFNKSYMEELKKIVEQAIDTGTQHNKLLNKLSVGHLNPENPILKNTKQDNTASRALKILREEMPNVSKELPQEKKYRQNICKYLNALFKYKLNNKNNLNGLTGWRKYLQILKKNSVVFLGVTTLTGITIYDILSFKTVNKVITADKITSTASKDANKVTPKPKLTENTTQNNEIIKAIELLKNEIGHEQYRTWFKTNNVKFYEQAEKVIALIPQRFIYDTIRNRYEEDIKKAGITMELIEDGNTPELVSTERVKHTVSEPRGFDIINNESTETPHYLEDIEDIEDVKDKKFPDEQVINKKIKNDSWKTQIKNILSKFI